ncbi:hypothetical protein PLESTB_000894000 [Pleodorina starrii]|uniref:UBA domain-containing protein n=1 Tax=Pleodorina starrii TaxID=330485 RepID=A0A9W6F346_9CHLO|nr:hypothetical protein PLESTM_000886900 [Pleodorina starrii]GLC54672.1 hypothetical protein PLESTB_000894000 [Pleodorina starrii]GLC67010.1 hypothetical protein PLESTF_000501800 [Pleodorina starrii]
MYAYPQRPGSVAPTPSSAFGQPQQQQPVYVPPPPPLSAPVPGLVNAASGSITTLRLTFSDDIRIEPPVAVSAALLPSASGSQAPACPDLSRERQLVETAPGQGESASGSSSSSSPDVDAYLAGLQAGALLREAAIQQLVAKGMSQAAAVLGVMYGRAAGRGGAEKAAEFAAGLEQLTTMGFSLPLAAGALAKHKGDLEAATESCLATAS